MILNKLKRLVAVAAIAISALSCDSFLDTQEIEEMTFDKIWETEYNTLRYLSHVYSYIVTENESRGDFLGASDEVDLSWRESHYGWKKMNAGNWSPIDVPSDRLHHYYRGIREATVFMQNIGRCTAPEISASERDDYYNEARFLRAYYYMQLLKQYGPIWLWYNELAPSIGADSEVFNRPRNTWDECVEWVCSEMTETGKKLPELYTISNHYGKPTSVVAEAMIARLKLYSARPLFNGNNLYVSLVNPDGRKLFNTTFDAQRWTDAAIAAKSAIVTAEGVGHKLSVVMDEDNPSEIDPYMSYYELFFNPDRASNLEMIWSYFGGLNLGGNDTRPAHYNGWAALGVTQQQVDQYAMSSGRYPIIGYNGEEYFLNQSGSNGLMRGRALCSTNPTVDAQSGYSESGYSTFANPALSPKDIRDTQYKTFDMYKDREPRFYMHIFWNNAPFYKSVDRDDHAGNIQFHSGGNSGDTNLDYVATGYLLRKFGNHKMTTSNDGTPTGSWPLLRMAELYLNYCETLVEIVANGASTKGLVLTHGSVRNELYYYINLIRNRAGLDNIEDVYSDKIDDVNWLRELVRRERRIELAFEMHRYWDTRQWKIAEYTNSTKMWGMNIKAKNSRFKDNPATAEDCFWQRVESPYYTYPRVFDLKHYLYPFNNHTLDRVDSAVQNYGW